MRTRSSPTPQTFDKLYRKILADSEMKFMKGYEYDGRFLRNFYSVMPFSVYKYLYLEISSVYHMATKITRKRLSWRIFMTYFCTHITERYLISHISSLTCMVLVWSLACMVYIGI